MRFYIENTDPAPSPYTSAYHGYYHPYHDTNEPPVPITLTFERDDHGSLVDLYINTPGYPCGDLPPYCDHPSSPPTVDRDSLVRARSALRALLPQIPGADRLAALPIQDATKHFAAQTLDPQTDDGRFLITCTAIYNLTLALLAIDSLDTPAPTPASN